MPVWALRLLPYLAAAALVWAAYVWAYSRGEASSLAELAAYKAEVAAERKRFDAEARKTEARHAAEMDRIAAEFAVTVKEAGNAAYDRAIADVRSGRLRNVWTCPKVPGPERPAGERDGGADDRAAAIARVLRIGAEADARLRACQAVILADRQAGG